MSGPEGTHPLSGAESLSPHKSKRHERRWSKGLDRGFTDEELRIVLQNAPKGKIKMCFELMAYLGLRVSEAIRVNRGDIDLTRESIRVFNSKLREWQYMSMPLAAYAAISEYLEEYGQKVDERGGFLVYNSLKAPPKGIRYVTETTVRRWLGEVLEKTGLDDAYKVIDSQGFQPGEKRRLKRLSPHSFRHHFGAKVYEESGRDLVLTSKLLRHTNISTTVTYLESINSRLREGIRAAFPARVEETPNVDVQEFMEIFRLYKKAKSEHRQPDSPFVPSRAAIPCL